MSQEEVLKALEKNGDMTENEIAEQLGLTISSVYQNLIRLVRTNEVGRKLDTSSCNKREHIYYLKGSNR